MNCIIKTTVGPENKTKPNPAQKPGQHVDLDTSP